MYYSEYKSNEYIFMEKAWQNGDILFEPYKPINWDAFIRSL